MLNDETSGSIGRMAYTIDETAELLSLSRSTVKEQLYQHKLKGKKLGRRWLIPRWAIAEFLATVAPASVSATDE